MGSLDRLRMDPGEIRVFALFLIPGLPDDVLCFVGGVTRVPLWQLVAIAVVGRAPGFFLSNLVGEFIGVDRFDLAAALAAALVAVTLLAYLNRARLFRYVSD